MEFIAYQDMGPTGETNDDGMSASLNATVAGMTDIFVNHSNVSVQQDKPSILPAIQGVQTIAFVVMVSVCSLFGTLGNIPVLLVYCTKTERRTANTFIKILAIIDLVVCAFIMPYTIVLELHLVTSDIICRLVEFVRHVSVGASNFTLVAIAVERYVAVCVIGHKMTVHNVNLGMVVVAGLSVLGAIPSMGLYAVRNKEEVQQVICAFPHDFQSNISFCHFTTSVLGPVLSAAYQTVLMVFFFITFSVIVIFYAIIFGTLWKRAKRRSAMQKFTIELDISSSSEKKVSCGPTDPDPTEEMQESQIRKELVLFQEEEVSQNDAGDRVSRPDALNNFNNWAKNKNQSAACFRSTQARRVHTRVGVHRRTARMLFLCTVVFLVTWLPFWVDVFSHTHNLCLRYLFFVGNASNPLVYGITNARFRKSLLKLLVNVKNYCLNCCSL